MMYMILDSTGSAVNEYGDEVAAHVALRNLVAADPDAADHLTLLAYSDDGLPIGNAITFDELPTSTTVVEESVWVMMARSCGIHLGDTSYMPTPRPLRLDPASRATEQLAAGA